MRHPLLRSRKDSGQSTLEFASMMALAAIVVLVVLGAASQAGIDKFLASSFCRVAAQFSVGTCAEGATKPQVVTPADVPDGLDPQSTLVTTLQSTERGRATLQWLADYNIPVVVDPDTTGAYWDGTQMVIGKGYDDAAVIVHETNHAKYTKAGLHADVNKLSRDAYIKAAIDEEADGTVQQIKAAREFRLAGHDVAVQPAETKYDDAFRLAKANGSSDAEADQAGYAAVNAEYYNGGLVTSTNGKSYVEVYGGYWDDAH
jgi:hypothetical protein